MKWKKLADEINAKTYVLPEGWDSREVVAEQLECSPDKVDDQLRPALKSGLVIKQTYPVFDKALGRKVNVVAYHDTSGDNAQPSVEFDLERAKTMKQGGKSYAEIGAALGCSGEAARAKLRRAQ